jgi:thiamine-monophosphate kinase
VSANIWIDDIPCSPPLREVSLELRRLCTLKGGDDYELCFTAPQKNRSLVQSLSEHLHLPLTRIGEVTKRIPKQPNLALLDKDNVPLPADLAKQYMRSFDHFK